MKTFFVALALVTLSVTTGLSQQLQQEARLALERLRASQQEARTSCELPDGTRRQVNATITYEGQAYRCVEVFTPTAPANVTPGQSQTLTVRMAGWVKL